MIPDTQYANYYKLRPKLSLPLPVLDCALQEISYV